MSSNNTESDFDRCLGKAMAEIAAARRMGAAFASGFLKQARFHVQLALEEAERSAAIQPDNAKFTKRSYEKEGN